MPGKVKDFEIKMAGITRINRIVLRQLIPVQTYSERRLFTGLDKAAFTV